MEIITSPRLNLSNTIITYPKKMHPIISRRSRRKVAKGGRGSAKSHSFAKLSLRRAATEKVRILCVRELQSSIKDSVHKLLTNKIRELKWDKFFRITDTSIKSWTGSEYVFRGLRNNYNEIKSFEDADICWLEEGEGVSQQSLDILIPTIRKDSSEIWVSYNPETKDSPCDKTFITQAHPDSIIVDINWRDNPWFPDVLMREKEIMKVVDFEKFLWVYEGQYKKYAQDVIFKDKIEVDSDFITPLDIKRFYFGLDFGFGVDPFSAHRMFEKEDGDYTDLYIDYEVYGLGIEFDQMHEKLFQGLPGLKYNPLMADNSRPDTINHLRKPFKKGSRTWPSINCVGASKAGISGDVKGTSKGSVKDGIDFLRSYRKIYIHKRCKGAKEDYQNYRWERDPKTQEILPEPVDKSNHSIDDNRYALSRLIQRKVSGFDVV